MTLFEAEFERCSKWLQDALDYAGNTHDLHHVAKGIKEGHFQFWPASEAVIVTELIYYPKFTILHAWLVGGQLEQVIKMIPSLEAYGRAFNCSKLTGCGRSGWVRALKQHGFEGIMTTVSKEIRHV